MVATPNSIRIVQKIHKNTNFDHFCVKSPPLLGLVHLHKFFLTSIYNIPSTESSNSSLSVRILIPKPKFTPNVFTSSILSLQTINRVCTLCTLFPYFQVMFGFLPPPQYYGQNFKIRDFVFSQDICTRRVGPNQIVRQFLPWKRTVSKLSQPKFVVFIKNTFLIFIHFNKVKFTNLTLLKWSETRHDILWT